MYVLKFLFAKPTAKVALTAALIVLSHSPLCSQNQTSVKDTIDLAELLHLISSQEDSSHLVLSAKHIIWNLPQKYLTFSNGTQIIEDSMLSHQNWKKLEGLSFYNCTFVSKPYNNHSTPSFQNLTCGDLVFHNCRFTDGAGGLGFRYQPRISFQNCSLQSISISQTPAVSWHFSHSQIGDITFLNNKDMKRVTLDSIMLNCPDTIRTENQAGHQKVTFTDVNGGFIALHNTDVKDLQLRDIFTKGNCYGQLKIAGVATQTIKINRVSLRDLRLVHAETSEKSHAYLEVSQSDFDSVLFSGVKVQSRIVVDDSTQINHWAFHSSHLPYNHINIPWWQLGANKISYRGYSIDSIAGQPYHNILEAPPHIYRDVLAFFKRWIDNYRYRGDKASQNAALVDLRKLEVKNLEQAYRESTSLKNWFYWQFYEFLRIYSAFGTDPLQALRISFLTIMLFAGFYFITPIEWGKHSTFTIAQMRYAVSAFYQDERSLVEILQTVEKRDSRRYENLPWYLRGQLYVLSTLHNLGAGGIFRPLARRPFFYKKFSELSNRQQRLFLWLGALTVPIGLLWILLVRALRALMISVNTFSTLGFGAIPVRGISKYLAVIQGFVGWLMLSLFSVALISQMVQV